MDEGSEVTEDLVFRGVEFSVKIEVDQRLLIVEISDLVTADQWRGDFDPACESLVSSLKLPLQERRAT